MGCAARLERRRRLGKGFRRPRVGTDACKGDAWIARRLVRAELERAADLQQAAEVRAGDAHGRRPRKNLHCYGRLHFRHFFAKQAGDGGLQHIGRQLTLQWQDFLANHLQALGLEFSFNQRLDFLDHHDLIDHCDKLAAHLEGHRAGETELEHRRIRE